MQPTIALLTDFGLSDAYVGQMKGVLAGLAPEARVLDLSHGVEPFALTQAAFFLEASRLYYPDNTIFVCVVDPGVGGDRRIVCVEVGGGFAVAPDNGLLSLTLNTPDTHRAFEVEPRQVRPGREPSATFHGRDIFAPAAAVLAQGRGADKLGPEIDRQDLLKLEWAEPSLSEGALTARVLHADRFGNLVLNLPVRDWPGSLADWPEMRLEIPERRALSLVNTYDELGHGEAGLLAGSQGFLEIAMRRASAAETLGLAREDTVIISGEPA
jgi:hypothetical protein